MNILGIIKETLVDGKGLRYAIYLSGCRHNCPGCHATFSHNPEKGIPFELLLTEIADDLNRSVVDGITLSGGDPFFNPEDLYFLLRFLKVNFPHLPIWVYTGYTMEQLLSTMELNRCLPYIDTIVDGRFIESLADDKLPYRGSSNQRILKVADFL